MRPALAGLIAVGFAAAVAGAGGQSNPSSPSPRVPVVIELFTSEGCSSCPPADDVLTKLLTTQPVPGAEIIAIGEHVDYWDRLGWRDPFSSADFSLRQSDYAVKAFHSDTRYTPQLVVDGREQFVGSDYRAATEAIARAAHTIKSPLRLVVGPDTASARTTTWNVRIDAPGGVSADMTTDVYLAVVEDGLSTEVRSGENGGRQLRHTAVARTMVPAGTAPKGMTPWSSTTAVKVDARWRRNHLHLVALAQDRKARAIVAAASALPPG